MYAPTGERDDDDDDDEWCFLPASSTFFLYNLLTGTECIHQYERTFKVFSKSVNSR